jgi:hypothetical protein
VESVAAKLMTTASDLVIGVGEVFGGGIAPTLAGFVANHDGLEHAMDLALGAPVIGLAVTACLKETALRCISPSCLGATWSGN